MPTTEVMGGMGGPSLSLCPSSIAYCCRTDKSPDPESASRRPATQFELGLLACCCRCAHADATARKSSGMQAPRFVAAGMTSSQPDRAPQSAPFDGLRRSGFSPFACLIYLVSHIWGGTAYPRQGPPCEHVCGRPLMQAYIPAVLLPVLAQGRAGLRSVCPRRVTINCPRCRRTSNSPTGFLAVCCIAAIGSDHSVSLSAGTERARVEGTITSSGQTMALILGPASLLLSRPTQAPPLLPWSPELASPLVTQASPVFTSRLARKASLRAPAPRHTSRPRELEPLSNCDPRVRGLVALSHWEQVEAVRDMESRHVTKVGNTKPHARLKASQSSLTA